jgi:hypothetical protein
MFSAKIDQRYPPERRIAADLAFVGWSHGQIRGTRRPPFLQPGKSSIQGLAGGLQTCQSIGDRGLRGVSGTARLPCPACLLCLQNVLSCLKRLSLLANGIDSGEYCHTTLA